MPIIEDYYRILQVHFLAEPEVIESAYKRLARKYHPDVNKAAGSEHRMKKINEAYETLSDTFKRRSYDAQRVRKPEMPQSTVYERPARPKDAPCVCPDAAKDVLIRYFDCIKTKEFNGAYALITSADKKNIALEDFVKWQSGVSRIYSLQEYSLKASKLETNSLLSGCIYAQSAEFAVTTVEHNSVMGKVEKDTIPKKVVFEDKDWRIYVGFDDITPYIARFDELNGLITAKAVISDMVEHYSYKDNRTGLYNKKGFSDAAQREIWRFDRYGNAFSVMLLEISLAKEIRQSKSLDITHHIAEWAGKILGDAFRKLDILGRWGETGFIVLLPETNLSGCFRVAKKTRKAFEAQPLVINKKTYNFKLHIGIEEFSGSLEDTIRNLNNYIDVAEKSKGSSIVYSKGVIE